MKVYQNMKLILAITSMALIFAHANISFAAEKYSPFTTKKTTVQKKASGFKSVLSLKNASPTEETHIFKGSEEQVEQLKKFQPIVEKLTIAVDAHNVMNRLKYFGNIQKQYNQMVQLHDKSVEILKASEQCTIDYLGRYFNKPITIWSGTNMLDDPENHDLRQGLSKWAIEMFEIAKSSEVSPFDVGDLSSIDSETADSFAKISEASNKETSEADAEINTNVGSPESRQITNLRDAQEQSKTQSQEMTDKHGDNYYKEPSKQDEVEKEARRIELISNDIGAVVSVWIADFLASENSSSVGSNGSPEWNINNLGGVKQRFPVWNDQRIFYTQYLDRKYKNICKFIQDYEIPADIRERISDAVYNSQKSLMSAAEIDITSAAVKASNVATAERDNKVADLRQKHNADISIINSKESVNINAQNTQKRAEVENIDKKIKEANDLRDEYATKISDINEENNRLRTEINNLNQELANIEMLLTGSEITEEQRTEYNQSKTVAQNEIKDAENKIAAANNEKTRLETLLSKQTDNVSALTQQKTDIENSYTQKINDIKTAAQNERNKLIVALNENIKKANEELAAKLQKIDLAEKAAKVTLGSKSLVTAKQIIATTNVVIDVAKEDACKNVNDTLVAMKELGDDLYRGQTQDIIREYHKTLFQSLIGKKSSYSSLSLPAVTVKVHDVTNFLTDIVTGIDSEMTTLLVANYRDKVMNTTALLEIPVFDKVLSAADSSVDTQYFVGSNAKLEDFRAPKTMPDFNLPPLREYVRLDYIDLQSIAKDAPKMYIGKYVTEEKKVLGQIIKNQVWQQIEKMPVGIIDKDKFLSYGGRIPEIWKLMLKDKAFVDSDFYLSAEMAPEGTDVPEKTLSLGGEMSPLYRGGIYPCVIKDASGCEGEGIENGKAVVDVSYVYPYKPKDYEYQMKLKMVTGERLTQLLSADLPTCQEVKLGCEVSFGLVNGRFAKTTKPNLTMLNKNNDIIKQKGEFITQGNYSELGSILGVYSGKMVKGGNFVKNVLAFNPYTQSTINYGIRMEERSEKDNPSEMTPEEKLNDSIYVRAQYNINQIGDFLNHVEVAQRYKEGLNEIEKEITTMKDELYTTLKNFGFEPSAEFDISKEADYNLAFNKLKSIKQSNMNAAKSDIDSIEIADSDYLYQSQSSYNRIYNGLALDKDAVNSMSMDVDDMTEFTENIKTGEVNKAVSDEYEGPVDENFEEQMNSFKPAYCAIY